MDLYSKPLLISEPAGKKQIVSSSLALSNTGDRLLWQIKSPKRCVWKKPRLILRLSFQNLFYLIAGLVPAAAWMLPDLAQAFPLNTALSGAVSTLPFLAFLAIGFLGFKLNQTRILVSSFILLALFYILRHPDALLPMGLGKIRLPQLLAVSLPLSFALVFLVKENKLLSQSTLLQVILAAAPPISLLILMSVEPTIFHELFLLKLVELPLKTKLPQVLFFSLVGLGLVTYLSRDIKVKPFMISLLWCMVPTLFAFHLSLTDLAPEQGEFFQNLSLLSVSIILLYAMFDMYWHRVYIDELTSVANRRALDEKMVRLDARYALAMVDIDHFKSFNDKYGHDEGDNALRLVASHLAKETGGRSFRYGGEEFCTVFEGADTDKAEAVMEAFRASLAKREFHVRLPAKRKPKDKDPHRGSGGHGKKLKITVSIGIAANSTKAPSPEEVIKLADKALYKAKEGGRNRVHLA